MVLENIISTVMNKVLGTYLEDITSEQVTLLLTQGNFELHNVRVRSTAVNSQLLNNTPILVTRGVLGRLKVAIQWHALRTSPLLIEIDNLRLIAGAKQPGCYDVEKIIQSTIQSKISLLQSLQTSQLQSFDEKTSTGSGIPAIALKAAAIIINSLQITLRGLHITVDHDETLKLSQEECKKLAGVHDGTQNEEIDESERDEGFYTETQLKQSQPPEPVREEIDIDLAKQRHKDDTSSSSSATQKTLQKHDESHSPSLEVDTSTEYPRLGIAIKRFDFLTNPDGVQKDVVIEDLFIYIDKAKTYSTQIDEDKSEHFDVFQNAKAGRFTYLLYPFSTTFPIMFDRKAKEGLAIRVHSATLKLEAMMGISQIQDIQKIVKPISDVSSEMSKIKGEVESSYRHGSAEERQEYIELYKRTLNATWLQPLSEAEKKRLEQLERELKYEDLQLCCSLAIAELRAELGGSQRVQTREQAQGWSGWLAKIITGREINATRSATKQLSQSDKERIYNQITSEGHSAPPISGPEDDTTDHNLNDISESDEEVEKESEAKESSKAQRQEAIPILKTLYVDMDIKVNVASFDIVDDSQSIRKPNPLLSFVINGVQSFSQIRDGSIDLRVGVTSVYLTDVSEKGNKLRDKPVYNQFKHLLAVETDVRHYPSPSSNKKDELARSEADDKLADAASSDDLNDITRLPIYATIQWRSSGIESIDDDESVGHAIKLGAASDEIARADALHDTKLHTTLDIEVNHAKLIVGSAVHRIFDITDLVKQTNSKESFNDKDVNEQMRETADRTHNGRAPVGKDTSKKPSDPADTEDAPQTAKASVAAMGLPNISLPSLPAKSPFLPLLLRVRVTSPYVVLPIDVTQGDTVALIATTNLSISTRVSSTESEPNQMNQIVYYPNVSTILKITNTKVFAFEYDLINNPNKELKPSSKTSTMINMKSLTLKQRMQPSHLLSKLSPPVPSMQHQQLPDPELMKMNTARLSQQGYVQSYELIFEPMHMRLSSRFIFIAITLKDTIMPQKQDEKEPQIVTKPMSLAEADHQHSHQQPSSPASRASLSRAMSAEVDHHKHSPSSAEPQSVADEVQQYVSQMDKHMSEVESEEDKHWKQILSGKKKLDVDETFDQLVPMGSGFFNESNLKITMNDFTLDVVNDTRAVDVPYFRLQVYDVNVIQSSFQQNRSVTSMIGLRADWFNPHVCVWEPVIEPLHTSVAVTQHYTLPTKEQVEALQAAQGEQQEKSTAGYPLISHVALSTSRHVEITLSQAFLVHLNTFSAQMSVVNRKRSDAIANGGDIHTDLIALVIGLRSRKEITLPYRFENRTELRIRYQFGKRSSGGDVKEEFRTAAAQHDEPSPEDTDKVHKEKDRMYKELQDTSSSDRDKKGGGAVKDRQEKREETKDDERKEFNNQGGVISEASEINKYDDVPTMTDDATVVDAYKTQRFGADTDFDIAEHVLAIEIGGDVPLEWKPFTISLLKSDTVRHTYRLPASIAQQITGGSSDATEEISVICDVYMDDKEGVTVVRLRSTTGIVNHTKQVIQVSNTENVQSNEADQRCATVLPDTIFWLPVLQTAVRINEVCIRPQSDGGEDKWKSNDNARGQIRGEHEWSQSIALQATLRGMDAFFRKVVTCRKQNSNATTQSVTGSADSEYSEIGFSAIIHGDNIMGKRIPVENEPCIQQRGDSSSVHGETKQPGDISKKAETFGNMPGEGQGQYEENHGTLYCVHTPIVIENLTATGVQFKLLQRRLRRGGSISIANDSSTLDKIGEKMGLKKGDTTNQSSEDDASKVDKPSADILRQSDIAGMRSQDDSGPRYEASPFMMAVPMSPNLRMRSLAPMPEFSLDSTDQSSSSTASGSGSSNAPSSPSSRQRQSQFTSSPLSRTQSTPQQRPYGTPQMRPAQAPSWSSSKWGEVWSETCNRGSIWDIYNSSLQQTLAITLCIPALGCTVFTEPLPIHIQSGEQTEESKALKGSKETKQVALISPLKTRNEHKKLYLSVEIEKLHGIGAFHIVVFSAYWLFDLTGLGLIMSPDKKVTPVRNVSESSIHQRNPNKPTPQGAIMFDFPPGTKTRELYVCAASEWSQAINVDAVKSKAQEIDVPSTPAQTGESKSHAHVAKPIYAINANVELGKGRYHRTKIVTLQPRIFVVNTLEDDLSIVQQGSDPTSAYLVPAKQQIAYHWQDSLLKSRMLQFRRSAEEYALWQWSAPFDAGSGGEFTMSVRHSTKVEKLWFPRVQVETNKNNATYITISEYEYTSNEKLDDQIDYRISNFTVNFIMRYRQARKPEKHAHKTSISDTKPPEWLTVYPLTSRPWVWQYVQEIEAVEVEIAEYREDVPVTWEGTIKCPLDNIGWKTQANLSTFKQNDHPPLRLSVEADGPIHVLYLRDYPRDDDWSTTKLGLSVPMPIKSELDYKIRSDEFHFLIHQLRASIKKLEQQREEGLKELIEKAKRRGKTSSKSGQPERPANLKPNETYLFCKLVNMKGAKLDKKEPNKYIITFNIQDAPALPQKAHVDEVAINKWYTFDAHHLTRQSKVVIAVYRRPSWFSSKKLVGQAIVPFSQLESHQPLVHWIPVKRVDEGHKNEELGQLEFKLWWVADDISYTGSIVEDIEEQLVEKRRMLKRAQWQLRVLEQRGGKLLSQRSDESKYPQKQQRRWSEFHIELLSSYNIASLLHSLSPDVEVSKVVAVLSSKRAVNTQSSVLIWDGTVSENVNDKHRIWGQPIELLLPSDLAEEEEIDVKLYAYPLPRNNINDDTSQQQKYDKDEMHESAMGGDDSKSSVRKYIYKKRESDLEFLSSLPPKPILLGHSTIPLSDIPIKADVGEETSEDREKNKDTKEEGKKGHIKADDSGDKKQQDIGKDEDGSVSHSKATTVIAGKKIVKTPNEPQIRLDEKLIEGQDQTRKGEEGKRDEEKRDDDHHHHQKEKDKGGNSRERSLSATPATEDVDQKYQQQQESEYVRTVKLQGVPNNVDVSIQLSASRYNWPEMRMRPHTTLSIYVPRIGLSIVDGVPAEVMYISLDAFLLRIQLTAERMAVQMVLNALQADDQLPDSIFPVVISQTPPETTDDDEQPEPPPIFQLALSQLLSYKSTMTFEYGSVMLQSLDIKVDEVVAWRLIAILLKVIQPEIEAGYQPTTRTIDEFRHSNQPSSTLHLYFRTLAIQPVSANLSFEPNPSIRSEFKDLRADYELVLYALSVGAAFTAVIENAPIRVSGQVIEHACGTVSMLIGTLLKAYKQQIIYQVLRVAGSLNIIGQPSSVIQKLGSQQTEMVYDPRTGIKPQKPRGSKQKGANFPQRAWQATFTSAGGFFSSLASGMAMMSLDDQYVKDRARDRHAQPVDVSSGVDKGMAAFEEGWSEGLTGVYSQPSKSMQEKRGAKDTSKNIATGVAGAIAKPMAGTAALAANTMKGVAKLGDPSSGWVKNKEYKHQYTVNRVRPQRAIVSNIVIPYTPNPHAVTQSAK